MIQLEKPIQILYLQSESSFCCLGRITGTKWLLREMLKPSKDRGTYKLEYGLV